MPTFAYQAITGAGKRLRGHEHAASSGALSRLLEETRAMAALLPVGMPLAQALNAACGVASGDVRTALQEIRSRVERGETLSAALTAYPHLFSPLYVGLVRAGEKSGDVDAAFARLSAQLEREEQLQGRILSA